MNKTKSIILGIILGLLLILTPATIIRLYPFADYDRILINLFLIPILATPFIPVLIIFSFYKEKNKIFAKALLFSSLLVLIFLLYNIDKYDIKPVVLRPSYFGGM